MESTERISITSFYFRMARTLVAKCASNHLSEVVEVVEVVGRKESLQRPIFNCFTSSKPCIKVRKVPVSCCVYGCTNRAGKTKVYGSSDSLRKKQDGGAGSQHLGCHFVDGKESVQML